jgi:hypothetical protein
MLPLGKAEDRSFYAIGMTTYIAQSHIHGWGAFAQGGYDAGETVETNPILVLGPDEVSSVLQTDLKRYIFYLKDSEADPDSCYAFVAMGNVSFCNHAEDANCHFDIDEEKGVIRLVALKPLIDGAEIFIDYGVYARDII